MTIFLDLVCKLCFYYPPAEFHVRKKKKKRTPHIFLCSKQSYCETWNSMESFGIPFLYTHSFLTSARNSAEELSPESFNDYNYREDGWIFLVSFFFFCLFCFCFCFCFFLWKHAQVMSYYFVLAHCQAAVSNLQTAWRLSSEESKSCAYFLTNE